VKRSSWHWQEELDSVELDTRALSVTIGLWSSSSRSAVVAALNKITTTMTRQDWKA